MVNQHISLDLFRRSVHNSAQCFQVNWILMDIDKTDLIHAIRNVATCPEEKKVENE